MFPIKLQESSRKTDYRFLSPEYFPSTGQTKSVESLTFDLLFRFYQNKTKSTQKIR